MIDPDFQV